MLNVEKQPYEILVRFGPNGEIAGAHWKALQIVTQNDETLSTNEKIDTLELPAPLAEQLKTLMSERLAETG
jgi:hypothetical protein